MSKYRVLYTDTDSGDFSVEAAVLAEIDAEVVMASALDEETLMREGEDCDGVMILYANITKRVLDHWGKKGKVKIVSRQGVGYNNIDVRAASENGICVANVPDYCMDEVADHAIALAMALLRELKSFDIRVQAGEWNESSVRPIHRTNTRVFGLIGLGNIGKRVASRAQAFGFRVVCYDPFVSKEQMDALGHGEGSKRRRTSPASAMSSLCIRRRPRRRRTSSTMR